MKKFAIYLLIGLMAVTVMACDDDNNSKDVVYDPVINPADFVTVINNPFLPLTPGTTIVLEGEEEDEGETIEIRDEIFVTHETKTIMGVSCIVVNDIVYEDGELVEDTSDWFAQDKDGNVWYFGEDSKDYEDGVLISTEGSWEAGVDGAKPGIVMLANPQAGGDSYRQEYYKDEAEDMARVISVSETVVIDYGTFNDCLQTEEWSPLEPGVTEHKFYAPGVGLILETKVEGGVEELELIEVTTD